MNYRTLLVLRWARMAKTGSFDLGYAIGYANAFKYDLPAWERQYLDVVMNRVIAGGRA